ncbi:hypothetical protein MSAS_06020 [Mycobacterium saskatchewanense]|nr:hypothetical protein MSAS_06020 [Mycobacterium saskatchewanense]
MCCEPTLYGGDRMGGAVVEDYVHVEVGGHFGVDGFQERHELLGAVVAVQCADDPVRWSGPGRHTPGSRGNTGWDRLSSWIWVFSSTHSVSAR